ncbi:DUF4345 family protein [Coralloluteibacterium thermophilus]|uniref:DUF4345 family protein n=1 Tax=Coralloluteibacterium thermophilum TaxID=2707049 RepID=A0ABV9NK78_9GAMM
MHRVPLLLLSITGASFLAYGLWYAFDLHGALSAVGIHVEGEIATTHLRTYLAGLQIALGVFLLACALLGSFRRPGLWLVLATHGGMALTRVLGIILDGPYAPVFFALLVWEVGVAFLALLALALVRDVPPARRRPRESATLAGPSAASRHDQHHQHPRPPARSPLRDPR